MYAPRLRGAPRSLRWSGGRSAPCCSAGRRWFSNGGGGEKFRTAGGEEQKQEEQGGEEEEEGQEEKEGQQEEEEEGQEEPGLALTRPFFFVESPRVIRHAFFYVLVRSRRTSSRFSLGRRLPLRRPRRGCGRRVVAAAATALRVRAAAAPRRCLPASLLVGHLRGLACLAELGAAPRMSSNLVAALLFQEGIAGAGAALGLT